MVRAQLLGRGRHIEDARVLAAMREVPRHEFVPPGERADAYCDQPLPIGHGQTISQPFIVALMTEALQLTTADRVLEIGTGSGYQTAILARLVHQVYSIEIIPALALRAEAVLRHLGIENVTLREGDGHEGWPDQAPFDAIMATCAPRTRPLALERQLAIGGRMAIPIGGVGEDQQLQVLHKVSARELVLERLVPVRFVPMTGVQATDSAPASPPRDPT